MQQGAKGIFPWMWEIISCVFPWLESMCSVPGLWGYRTDKECWKLLEQSPLASRSFSVVFAFSLRPACCIVRVSIPTDGKRTACCSAYRVGSSPKWALICSFLLHSVPWSSSKHLIPALEISYFEIKLQWKYGATVSPSFECNGCDHCNGQRSYVLIFYFKQNAYTHTHIYIYTHWMVSISTFGSGFHWLLSVSSTQCLGLHHARQQCLSSNVLFIRTVTSLITFSSVCSNILTFANLKVVPSYKAIPAEKKSLFLTWNNKNKNYVAYCP